MATLAADERRNLQMFLEAVSDDFRTLMMRVVNAVVEGGYVLEPYEAGRSADDDLSRLIEALGAVQTASSSSRSTT
jgi:hypothetical protein